MEVLARLNETIDAIETAYREYQFNTVAQRLYEFIWSDYCDWFVEAAKTDIFSGDEARKNSVLAVMDFVLSAMSRLASSVYAAHYRGALVVARPGNGIDSVRRAAKEDRLRRCRSWAKA